MMLERLPDEHLQARAAAAEVYLKNAFGQRLDLTPVAPTSLPHFVLDRYKLWQGLLNGRTLILMAIREPGQGATTDYLKHRDLVRRQLGAELVVLLLDHVPNVIRRQMVERKISFLAPGAQLYIPEALLDLRERAPALTAAPPVQITPTTQLVLLAVLQGLELEDANLTELAERFKSAIMSMSRTLDELEALQLARDRRVGRQRRLHMTVGGRELWDAVRDRLQSPVRKARIVAGPVADHVAPLAGESALAHYTMLAKPRTATRAVPAVRWKRLQQSPNFEPATAFDDNRVEIETWTYDPRILERDGVVDPLSLYLAVRGSRDERVTQAAEDLLKDFEW